MNNQLENEIRKAYPDGLTWQKTVPTFHPESSEQAADLFSRARKHGRKLYISGFGNNINPVGPEFADLLVIKSDRLNSIIDIGGQDLYVTVGSGYPLKELNKTIADQSLWFQFADTNYAGSFGGALATGLAGNDGVHIVPLSRYLLSVTAVLPDGSIVRPGALTFKSVSGYDISRIFFNSWGTLGMVTELSFRVFPLSRRDQMPHLTIFPPNMDAFKKELEGETPLSEICRKIKKDFDPDNLLPLI